MDNNVAFPAVIGVSSAATLTPEPTWPTAPALVAEAPAANVHSGLQVEIHATLAAAEAAWTAFEATADCTPFQLFARLAKWQQHVGERRGVTPAIVCCRDNKGSLLAILPLAVTGQGPVRRLSWLGSDLSDYNAPLLAPHFATTVDASRVLLLWEEICAQMQGQARWQFDLIDLSKMPGRIGAQPNPLLALGVITNPNPALAATLGGKWDDFYAAKRSTATRKRERKQLRQLGEHGEVRFVEPRDDADRLATLETMLAQKARSFARMGVDNIFGRLGHCEFLRDLVTDPSLRDVVHMTRLDVGATPAAASLALRLRGTYYLILSSYHDGDISRFGPGRAHLHELLRHAMDGGFERFDFTIGEEAYKRDWSDIEVSVYDHLTGVTPRGWLSVGLHALLRHAKREIKRNPRLWHGARKARALAGSVTARLRPSSAAPAPLPEIPSLYSLAPEASDMALAAITVPAARETLNA